MNPRYLERHYGRLYDWDTANNIAPEGWRLPSDEDFKKLKDFIIKDNGLTNDETVGKYLKSVTGFKYAPAGNDKYGFNALPAGYRYDYGSNFIGAGENTHFWSTPESSSDCATNWGLNYNGGGFYYGSSSYGSKSLGFSVRCLKNKE